MVNEWQYSDIATICMQAENYTMFISLSSIAQNCCAQVHDCINSKCHWYEQQKVELTSTHCQVLLWSLIKSAKKTNKSLLGTNLTTNKSLLCTTEREMIS